MISERARAVFEEFGAEIVLGAKRRIGTRRIGRNKRYGEATGKLKQSLDFRLDGNTMYFLINPPADTYGQFLNLGVNGTEVNQGSPYSFGSKQPPSDAIMAWIKSKPVRMRNAKGEFVQSTPARIRSAAFMIARSIKRKGIYGLHFYENSYDALLPSWQDKIADAMAYDVADLIAEQMKFTDLTEETSS